MPVSRMYLHFKILSALFLLKAGQPFYYRLTIVEEVSERLIVLSFFARVICHICNKSKII
jgi:hypothetical protein